MSKLAMLLKYSSLICIVKYVLKIIIEIKTEGNHFMDIGHFYFEHTIALHELYNYEYNIIAL